MISEKALSEYKRIYKTKTGKELSDADALEQATRLITLVRAVYKPIPRKKDEKNSQSCQKTSG